MHVFCQDTARGVNLMPRTIDFPDRVTIVPPSRHRAAGLAALAVAAAAVTA
jgi:hypothetical protein